MFSLYDWFMKPLEKRGIHRARSILIPQASGKVLELGAGTGANGPHYDNERIEELVITDRKRRKHLAIVSTKATFVVADAMNLPFDDNSFDTVVHTLVFCSVPDVDQGLREIKRVLKPGGQLIFIEHVLPHKHGWRRLFRTINPLWRVVASGCNLTRDFPASLTKHGFSVHPEGRFMNTIFYYGIATMKANTT